MGLAFRFLILAVLFGLGTTLSACLAEPDPEAAGVYACEISLDCPGVQNCLQGTCEMAELPRVEILSPEDGDALGHGREHTINISIATTDLALRSLDESDQAVPGEGHLVVFVDEQEVGVIDRGDAGEVVQLSASVADEPGAHRIRVQARLNDGTDYDNPEASPRTLIWVDDDRPHLAFRSPWPGERFELEAQEIEVEVAVFGGLSIGPPSSGDEHVHVYYDQLFPDCLDDRSCEDGHNGVVPSPEDPFGPMIIPSESAGEVTLTALVRNSDHSRYLDDEGEAVWSQVQVLRASL